MFWKNSPGALSAISTMPPSSSSPSFATRVLEEYPGSSKTNAPLRSAFRPIQANTTIIKPNINHKLDLTIACVDDYAPKTTTTRVTVKEQTPGFGLVRINQAIYLLQMHTFVNWGAVTSWMRSTSKTTRDPAMIGSDISIRTLERVYALLSTAWLYSRNMNRNAANIPAAGEFNFSSQKVQSNGNKCQDYCLGINDFFNTCTHK